MHSIRSIRMDIQRAFCSNLFIAGILCTVGVCYLNISWDNMLAPSVMYLVAGLAFGSQVQVLFVCGALPYATAYLNDWNNGYIRLLVIRGNLRSYLRSKVLVTALSGFFSVFIGKLLFVSSLCLFYPWTSEFDVPDKIGVNLLYYIHPWAYFIGDALLYALAAAGFAVMALLVSGFVLNTFVTIASPLVLFFAITSIYQIFHLPQGIDLNALTMGYIYAYADSWQFTLLHIIIVWLIVILIAGKLFIWRAERRFYHGC